MSSLHTSCSLLHLFQDAVTTDECAARLKAGASSATGGTDDQCWRGLDRLVCIDSTWQQTTGIMKVSTHHLSLMNRDTCLEEQGWGSMMMIKLIRLTKAKY